MIIHPSSTFDKDQSKVNSSLLFCDEMKLIGKVGEPTGYHLSSFWLKRTDSFELNVHLTTLPGDCNEKANKNIELQNIFQYFKLTLIKYGESTNLLDKS